MNNNELNTFYEDEEKKVPTFLEYLDFPTFDNWEKLVSVNKYNKDIILDTKPHKNTLAPSTWKNIYVRETVARKLANVQDILSREELYLTAVYWWRSPEVQESVFNEVTEKYKLENPEWTTEECMIEANRFIWHPWIAPHPTGGAIDLLIQKRNGEFLDYGTEIHTLMTKKTYLNSPEVSETVKENRKKLSDLMEWQGFYTYPLEWWHYDYGDKLWWFLGKNGTAIYWPIFPNKIKY